LNELFKTLSVRGTVGIGHTRWATHGVPDETNAHPQVGEVSKIAVVHNGIIENYLTLKNKLTKEGFIFRSQTDTEVILCLIEKYFAGDLEKAFEAIEEMQADGLAPDVITYTSLIKACGSTLGPKAASTAEEIFETMQQRTNHFSTYIEPNEFN
jgi:glutamine phosphoribosylpyrophosphate amidotransferase